MRVTVDVRMGQQPAVSLGAGAIIGRLWTADLQINDGRISEAHAAVSLRGHDLVLLALRGRFRVDGQVLSSVVLTPGLQVELASGLFMGIEAVHVPASVLALQGPGLPRQVLAGVCSLYGGPRPRLVKGWKADADLHLWPTGDRWMCGDPPREVEPGDRLEVAGQHYEALLVHTPSVDATRYEADLAKPLTIVANYDTVHLKRRDAAVVVFSGIAARIISELVCAGVPLSWEDLARTFWGGLDRNKLRGRWDMHMVRIRRRLRENSVREDLIRPDGSGLVELVLGPEDRVVDAT